MADKIVLDHPRYKGEYEFDIDDEPFTNLEWRWVKKISGYLPLTLDEGWRGRDPDLFVAFAVISLHRAGKVTATDALAVAASFDDLEFGSIRLVGTVEEEGEQENPPEPVSAPEPVQQPRNTGPSSEQTSGTPDDDLSLTGALA